MGYYSDLLAAVPELFSTQRRDDRTVDGRDLTVMRNGQLYNRLPVSTAAQAAQYGLTDPSKMPQMLQNYGAAAMNQAVFDEGAGEWVVPANTLVKAADATNGGFDWGLGAMGLMAGGMGALAFGPSLGAAAAGNAVDPLAFTAADAGLYGASAAGLPEAAGAAGGAAVTGGGATSGATAASAAGGLSATLPTTAQGWAQLIGGGASALNMLNSAGNIQSAGNQAAALQNPFGPYRDQYAQQLNALMTNPQGIQNVPGYAAGLQAVERRGAAQGWNGSGNMQDAMSNYGGNFYNQYIANLSNLAGANINPAAAGQSLLAGATGSASASNQGLYQAGGLFATPQQGLTSAQMAQMAALYNNQQTTAAVKPPAATDPWSTVQV